MKRLKQLGKDSFVYGAGGIAAKGIPFLLLPIYTRIFTPSEYGNIEMMVMAVSIVTVFLVMGMDSAQSFYFFEQKKGGKAAQKILVSSILQWRLTWGVPIVILAIVVAPIISAFFFEGVLPRHYFAVAFLGALFAAIQGQSVEIFRLLYRPWPYIGITITNAVLTSGLILIFVVLFAQGILGYFIGTTIAACIVAIMGWYCVRDYVDFSAYHRSWWPRLLTFGVPLLPAGLATYIMNTADRWFLQHYLGFEALGIYAIGAKVAFATALFSETFRKAWWPIAMDALHSDDGPETFQVIARMFLGLGGAAVIQLTFISPWLVRLLSSPAYYSSWSIVGVLAWQSIFYGFYMVASPGIWKAKKTYLFMLLLSFAALLNIVLNYLLVPRYGCMGAAIATVFSHLVWVVVSLLISERLWYVGFPLGVLSAQITFGFMVTGLLLLVPEKCPFQNLFVSSFSTLILIFLSVDSTKRKYIFDEIAQWKNSFKH